MRTNLKVPFAERDQAKQLGARWDPALKLWYIENKADLSPFSRWLASEEALSAGGSAASKSSPDKGIQSDGIINVGSKYVAHPRVCDCVPWEDCDACRPFVLPNHASR